MDRLSVEERSDLARALWAFVPEDLRRSDWQWGLEWTSVRPWWITDFPGGTSAWRPPYWFLDDPDSPLHDKRLAFVLAESLRFNAADVRALRDRVAPRERRDTADSSESDSTLLNLLESFSADGGSSLLSGAIGAEYGEEAARAFSTYASIRQAGAQSDWAKSYESLLLLLPATESTFAERTRAALSSGDAGWASDLLETIFGDGSCPLWVRGACAFGLWVGDELIETSNADPLRIILSLDSPNEALYQVLAVTPTPVFSIPHLDTDMLLGDFPPWAAEWPSAPPIWGDTWSGGDDYSGTEQLALCATAAIVAALLHSGAERSLEESSALIVACEQLLTRLLELGIAPLASRVAAVLEEGLCDYEEALRAIEREHWFDASDPWDSRGSEWLPDSWAAIHAWVGGVIAACALIARPRASLLIEAASLPDSVRAVVSALPPDVVLGGESSPDAVIARLNAIEDRLPPPDRPPEAAAANDRGLVLLRERVGPVDDLAWQFQSELLWALGQPHDAPALSAVLLRASELEKMMHLTFPGLPRESTLWTLAQDLRLNNRRGSVRILSAEEGRTLAGAIDTGRWSRNRAAHPRFTDSIPESSLAYWLPERYPPHATEHDMFDVLREFARIQRLRANK